MPTEHRSTPVACTLPASDHAARIAWIAQLNATALDTYRRAGNRIWLRYRPAAAAQARELVHRERECCPFLRFSTEEDDDAFVVMIDAPAHLGTAADDLFAPYTQPGSQS